MLIFEPITNSNFLEALTLASKVFPNHKEEIEKAYKRVLDPTTAYLDERRILEYYAGKDTYLNKIVSVTGIYNRKEYPEDEVWLGWFCVDPIMRGKGIGRETLEWTIKKARELGYKKFKLYTSTDPNEAFAQNLYESVGLKIYKREPNEKFPQEEILYREIEI